MKPKAPQGAGDPCVAGVVLAARDGLYEVEAETGALLVECFGFVEAGAHETVKTVPSASGPPRRRAPAKRSSS